MEEVIQKTLTNFQNIVKKEYYLVLHFPDHLYIFDFDLPQLENFIKLRLLIIPEDSLKDQVSFHVMKKDPDEMASVIKLLPETQRGLGFYGLTGEWKNSIWREISSHLRNLERLDCVSINMNSKFPEEIFNLTNLRILRLINCNLVGEVPDNFTKIKNLRKLSLSNNRLTGKIPQSIRHLPLLETIKFSHNDFSDIGTSFFLKKHKFKRVIFCHNPNLKGTITGLKDLTTLLICRLNDTNLGGTIDDQLFRNNTNLHRILMKNTRIKNKLDEFFMRCDMRKERAIETIHKLIDIMEEMEKEEKLEKDNNIYLTGFLKRKREDHEEIIVLTKKVKKINIEK